MSNPLADQSIPVVEDEYMIAYDVVNELESLGATVIGTCVNVPKAMEMLNSANAIDAAVLDISLRDHLVYKVADRLAERAVPIVFATGYNAGFIPQRYQHIPRCEKPIAPGTFGALVAARLTRQ